MNAVIYARYSSDHQREESIEGQIRECNAFAKRNNLTVIGNYIDRAISGRTDNRPEFQRMIEASASKGFSFVIVYTLDRFARNRAASAMYKMKLRQNGVKVLSAKENIADDPSGIILESVLEGIAEYYSAELAQKITRGMTENALAGRWTSGAVPFGFLRDDNKHLIPNPQTAPFVTIIFDMFDAGYKYVDVRNFLNAHGVKTRMGKEFTRSSFVTLMSNEIYIGKFKWNNVVIEDYVAPLVSKEVFMRCQKRIRAIRKARTVRVRRSDTYPLAGKFFCGHCGGMMHGMSGTARNGDLLYYYACSNRRLKKTDCPVTSVPRDMLEDAIFTRASKLLSDKNNIDIIASQAVALNKKEENALLVSLKMQRKETKAKIDNCIKAIESGIFSETLSQTIQSHEQSLKNIDAAIAEETLASATPTITKQRVVYFLSKILEGEAAKENVLNVLVRNVCIKKEKDDNSYKVIVSFNYTGTQTLSNEIDFTLPMVREIDDLVNLASNSANLLKYIDFKADYFQVSFTLPKKFIHRKKRHA